jgi:hypothetical protein
MLRRAMRKSPGEKEFGAHVLAVDLLKCGRTRHATRMILFTFRVSSGVFHQIGL